MDTLRSFFISFIVLVLADFIWLGFIMKPFIQRELGSLMREGGLLIGPAAFVYALLAIGISYFVIPRIGLNSFWGNAFLVGALFGLIVYGVYDLTNVSVLKGYSWKFLFVDIAWGTFACGLTTVIVFLLTRSGE